MAFILFTLNHIHENLKLNLTTSLSTVSDIYVWLVIPKLDNISHSKNIVFQKCYASTILHVCRFNVCSMKFEER